MSCEKRKINDLSTEELGKAYSSHLLGAREQISLSRERGALGDEDGAMSAYRVYKRHKTRMGKVSAELFNRTMIMESMGLKLHTVLDETDINDIP